MSICLRLGTVGRYCVTKDKIRLYSLHFCRRACFLFSNLISESVAVQSNLDYPDLDYPDFSIIRTFSLVPFFS